MIFMRVYEQAHISSYRFIKDKLGGEGAILVNLKRNKRDSKYD